MHSVQVQTKQFARCNAGKIVLANCKRVVWHMSPGVRPATVRVAVSHLCVQMPHDPPLARTKRTTSAVNSCSPAPAVRTQKTVCIESLLERGPQSYAYDFIAAANHGACVARNSGSASQRATCACSAAYGASPPNTSSDSLRNVEMQATVTSA